MPFLFLHSVRFNCNRGFTSIHNPGPNPNIHHPVILEHCLCHHYQCTTPLIGTMFSPPVEKVKLRVFPFLSHLPIYGFISPGIINVCNKMTNIGHAYLCFFPFAASNHWTTDWQDFFFRNSPQYHCSFRKYEADTEGFTFDLAQTTSCRGSLHYMVNRPSLCTVGTVALTHTGQWQTEDLLQIF